MVYDIIVLIIIYYVDVSVDDIPNNNKLKY